MYDGMPFFQGKGDSVNYVVAKLSVHGEELHPTKDVVISMHT